MTHQKFFLKKALLFFLLLSLLVTLFGCGKIVPDDQVLIEHARELIEKTRTINYLFYENGIPMDEKVAAENNYRKADAAALEKLGFARVSDILAYMRTIWAEGYVNRIEESALLNAVVGQNGMGSYAYCFDKTDTNGQFVSVMVLESGLPFKTDQTIYHYDTLAVKEKTSERAVLTISVTVTDDEQNSKDLVLSIVILAENDGEWRLNTNTAVKFPEESYPLPL